MSENLLSDEMIREFTDFSTSRHKATILSKEAFLYFPNEIEIIEYNSKNLDKLTRKIFEGGVEYICFEKGKLEELEVEIDLFNKNKKNLNKKLIFPSDWREYNSLRFLQATGFDVKKTIEIIINHLDWRKDNLLPKITNKVMEILNIGFLYIHGRDNRFRPIIHINVSIVNKNTKKYTFDDWSLATIFFMEYTIKNLLLPGQIENWDILCDLKDVSVMSLPNDFKKILGILQNNYRCRLYRMYIVNVGSFFNMMWIVIKKIIDANTEKKIRILKAGNTYEIFELINSNQIEKKYCGLAENVTNYFFPPIFPSDKYQTDFEDKSNLFVDEEEYIKRITSNTNLIRSPYILKKESVNSENDKDDFKIAENENEIKEIENIVKEDSDDLDAKENFEKAPVKNDNDEDQFKKFEKVTVENDKFDDQFKKYEEATDKNDNFDDELINIKFKTKNNLKFNLGTNTLSVIQELNETQGKTKMSIRILIIYYLYAKTFE